MPVQVVFDDRLQLFRDFMEGLQLNELVIVPHVDQEIRLCDFCRISDIFRQLKQLGFVHRAVFADDIVCVSRMDFVRHDLSVLGDPASVEILRVVTFMAFPLVENSPVGIVGFDPFDVSVMLLQRGQDLPAAYLPGAAIIPIPDAAMGTVVNDRFAMRGIVLACRT